MISNELIHRTFEYYNQFKKEKFVVNPSIPILYFGDLHGYRSSKLKIITVGKNPSHNEFRINKNDNYSFDRFTKWNESEKNLIETLNDYFKERPFQSWFSSFEPILNGLNASYYPGSWSSTALHTDICSPIATEPTWSKLNVADRDLLFEEGLSIWKDLIEELQPDILIASFRKDIFKAVFNPEREELLEIKQKKNGENRKYPYKIYAHSYPLKNKVTKVIFGNAANKPFDTISHSQKLEIGAKCFASFGSYHVLGE
jgi:hypothetical protein